MGLLPSYISIFIEFHATNRDYNNHEYLSKDFFNSRMVNFPYVRDLCESLSKRNYI